MRLTFFSELGKASELLSESEQEIERRDDDVKNLKLIIQRLTKNNNDMLAILSSKASIDDIVKKLESDNLKLTIDAEAIRQRNLALEMKLRENESEAARLQRIIRSYFVHVQSLAFADRVFLPHPCSSLAPWTVRVIYLVTSVKTYSDYHLMVNCTVISCRRQTKRRR